MNQRGQGEGLALIYAGLWILTFLVTEIVLLINGINPNIIAVSILSFGPPLIVMGLIRAGWIG